MPRILYLLIALAAVMAAQPLALQAGATVNAPDAHMAGEAKEEPGSYAHDIEGAMSTRGIGDPDAPVRMLDFSSLTCGHCATFHVGTLPKIKEKYVDTGKLYIEFRDFPLNLQALEAAQLARCMPKDKYYNFYMLLFETMEEWAFSSDYRNKLIQNAKLAGMIEEDIDSCLHNEKLQEAIATTMSESADKWEITSTPTFVFNGGAEKIVGAQSMDRFDEVIGKLLDKSRKDGAGKTGEQQ